MTSLLSFSTFVLVAEPCRRAPRGPWGPEDPGHGPRWVLVLHIKNKKKKTKNTTALFLSLESFAYRRLSIHLLRDSSWIFFFFYRVNVVPSVKYVYDMAWEIFFCDDQSIRCTVSPFFFRAFVLYFYFYIFLSIVKWICDTNFLSWFSFEELFFNFLSEKVAQDVPTWSEREELRNLIVSIRF